MESVGKVVVLTAAHVSPKSQHKQWYLHTYADHPCRGHWCTPIPLQRLVLALFIENSLDGLFHLRHVESKVCFFPKISWKVDASDQRTRFHCLSVHLRWLHAQRTRQRFCAKFLNAKYNFKLHFLMQRRTEWQWFSKVLLSPCGYIHHGSMMVSQTITPDGRQYFVA